MIFSEDRVKGPYSETDAKKIFADAGLDWETRKERYETIDETIWAQVPGKWWGAYDEKGKPISSQGIGNFQGVKLLLGLKSFAEDIGEGHKGYGKGIAKYIVDRNSDKPMLGMAKDGGQYIFPSIGFRKLKFDNTGLLQNEEDLPTEVKSALEIGNTNPSLMGIRKLFYLPAASWWILVKGGF